MQTILSENSSIMQLPNYLRDPEKRIAFNRIKNA